MPQIGNPAEPDVEEIIVALSLLLVILVMVCSVVAVFSEREPWDDWD